MGTSRDEVTGLTSCQGLHGISGTFVETLTLESVDKERHGPELSSERPVMTRLHPSTEAFGGGLVSQALFSQTRAPIALKMGDSEPGETESHRVNRKNFLERTTFRVFWTGEFLRHGNNQ